MAPMKVDPPAQFTASSMTGKTFAVISLTNTASTTASSQGMQQALSAVGATTTISYGQGKPDVITQQFQQAIAQHVAGIVTFGIPVAVAPSAYAAAAQAKIPMVAANGGDPHAALPNGVSALLSISGADLGALQVDYALAHSKCKLHAATFYASTAGLTIAMLHGEQAELASLCPTDCSLDVVTVDVATYRTTLAGQVQTEIQRSSNINYLLSTADTFVPYVIQGEKAAGSQAPIVGALGDGLAAAISGSGDTADVMQPPATLVGYYAADAIMRAAAGSPTSYALPLRLVDSSNWGTSADDSAQFPALVGYQDTFKKAWGV